MAEDLVGVIQHIDVSNLACGAGLRERLFQRVRRAVASKRRITRICIPVIRCRTTPAAITSQPRCEFERPTFDCPTRRNGWSRFYPPGREGFGLRRLP